MKFTVETFVDVKNGDIKQAMIEDVEGSLTRLAEWTLRTREAGVRQGLIDLGWTPPNTPTLQSDQMTDKSRVELLEETLVEKMQEIARLEKAVGLLSEKLGNSPLSRHPPGLYARSPECMRHRYCSQCWREWAMAAAKQETEGGK